MIVIRASFEICCAIPLVGISPGEVACIVAVVTGGAGGTKPTVGTSPAKVVVERALVKATVITKRFMYVSPLKVGDARVLTSERIEQHPEIPCKVLGQALNIRACSCKLSYTHAERHISHEDNLT